MTAPVRAGQTYSQTGQLLMARQIIFHVASFGGFLPLIVVHVLGNIGHPLYLAMSVTYLIEQATNVSLVPVTQCSYSMILQTGEEMDREMEETIPWMTENLQLYSDNIIPYSVVNPLGGLVYTERKHALGANMAAYQAILDHWHDTWEWTTTVVTEVTDGDTIYAAAYEDPIRVEGINCPEICHEAYDDCDPADPKWAAGYAAKDYATTILLGTTVKLRVRKQRDFYGRLLAKVFIGDWADGWEVFGTNMVRNGHAKFYEWSFPTTLTH